LAYLPPFGRRRNELIPAAHDLHRAFEFDVKGAAGRHLDQILVELRNAITALPARERQTILDTTIQTDTGMKRLGDWPALRN